MLINNFVANSVEFFNTFAENVEEKISTVSNKVTELETLLAVLEAKLNSVPGLEFSADDLPQAAPAAAPSTSAAPAPAAPAPAPAPIPTPKPVQQEIAPVAQNNSESSLVVHQNEEDSMALVPQGEGGGSDGMVPAFEHPDYAPFFKLLKVGVPLPVVQAKVAAAGLDSSIMGTADALIPL